MNKNTKLCTLIIAIFLSVFLTYALRASIFPHRGNRHSTKKLEWNIAPLNLFLSKEVYVVRRRDLNTPISPYRLHFQVLTSGIGNTKCVRLIILAGETIKWNRGRLQIENQIPSESCVWQLRSSDEGKPTHEWIVKFLRDYDGVYYTEVTLPDEDLEHSWLYVYIEDVDGRGDKEHLGFQLDMTKYDWTHTTRLFAQGL